MNNFRGAVLMIISMAIFAVVDMFIKQATALVPLGVVLMVLGLFGALVFSGLVAINGQQQFPKELLSPVVLLRNVGELLGTLCYVVALSLTTLSSASAIHQMLPLFVTLLGAIFLGEHVGRRRWMAIGVGFFGMLMIVRPGAAGFEAGTLLAVLAVTAFALRDMSTRIAPPSMTSLQLVQWGLTMIFLLGVAMTLAVGGVGPVPAEAVQILVQIALVGAVGYYLIVEALRRADLSAIAPYRYTRLVFALAVAAAFLDERPDTFTLAGAGLIIASGLYMLARERAVFITARHG